jgi:hypothetical protein
MRHLRDWRGGRPAVAAIALASAVAVWVGGSPAQAGAWAREKGDLFLSFGGNIALFDGATRPVHYDPTLYVEYGLTDRLTVGFDGYTSDATAVVNGFVFLRYPIGSTDGPQRLAFSVAAGASEIPGLALETTGRIGLHWGYSLTRGWLAADATSVLGLAVGEREGKVEFTWGRQLTDRWTGTLQLQGGVGFSGDTYAKVTPAIMYDLGDTTSLRAGFVQALTGDMGSALTLEVWLSF